MTSPLLLGIDTGGTYTDAVLLDEQTGVLAKAKSLTTRHDLSIGIEGAVSDVLKRGNVGAERIELVSLSTTLATNALVEGQGTRAALVMIGFSPKDLKRDGLEQALGSDPVIFLEGGHNVHGRENSLDLDPLAAALGQLESDVSAVAIAGYFAVRNPAHEEAARDLIRDRTGLPVTCSHELSSRLGGPRRALTTLLNARLIAMIDHLIDATHGFLKSRGIQAPLMVVRGDGALISDHLARARPIETILSGPAASLVGARHLTGAASAVVSDIGGTTTDIAILENGLPRLDPDGAIVGGYRTMVEAVAMRTFGLGGDSEVHFQETGLETILSLGPRRLVPVSLAATLDPDPVLSALRIQEKSDRPSRLDARFARLTSLSAAVTAGLQPQEQALLNAISERFEPLDRVLTAAPQRATLDKLQARGLVQVAGFTPSDAMHVLGRQDTWNDEAALSAGTILARRKNGAGNPLAGGPKALARWVIETLTRRSADAILSTCLADDGVSGFDPSKSMAVDKALSPKSGIVSFSISLDRPVIGLGASAPAYYPDITTALSSESMIPSDADVANAIGAVAGHIRITKEVVVTQTGEGRFTIHDGGMGTQFSHEDDAIQSARETAKQLAFTAAIDAGASDPTVSLSEQIHAPTIEGARTLVEARISATASGRPRIARDAH